MTMEQYLDSEKQTVDEFEADLEKRVRDAVAAQFVLDSIAKKEEIGVNEGELQEHLMRRGQQAGENPQEFMQHMIEHNHIPEMVSEVVRGKALASVVEAANVTDASGNHVELKNLQPDGTTGEPATPLFESVELLEDDEDGQDGEDAGRPINPVSGESTEENADA